MSLLDEHENEHFIYPLYCFTIDKVFTYTYMHAVLDSHTVGTNDVLILQMIKLRLQEVK